VNAGTAQIKAFRCTTVFVLLSIVSFIMPVPAQQAADPGNEQRMSLDVKDTDLRDVIRMISKGYNLNILLDQDVSGKVTLHLSDVPIMEGLRSIAESNGLIVVREGSVYKIQKATPEARSLIRYAEGKLTVDVQNVDIKEFLKELSTKTAVSIVPDAKVSGTLSGKLYQVPLDDGLRALLESNGFKVTKRRNIYQVVTESPPAQSMPSPRSRSSSSGSNFHVDFNNGLLTVDVTNGDLEDIIRAIAEQSDVEIVTYGSIKSEVNAKLNGIPLTEALALLLGGTRFTFVQKENVILIGDRNTATPSGQALSKSELVHLNHIKADNVPAILPKDIPPTNVRVIKEQNALLISGTSEDIVQAREFLQTIDIPTPQVRIDAVIVEYKDNLDREFGLKYGHPGKFKGQSYHVTPSPGTRMSEGANEFELGATLKFVKELLADVFNQGKELTRIRRLPDNFFVILRFLENQDKAKVLAQPSIMTLNGNKASIDVSETQYFRLTTGAPTSENYTVRFQPIKFGIQLDITPWISQSGQITAEITPQVSNSEKVNTEGYPNVSTRSITTTVRLNDGETLVLGGLVKNQETQFHHKIPILGDIPLLGALFRYSGKTKIKSNLVVYITPRIITRDQKVNLSEELEKLNLDNKGFIERQIYQGIKGVRSKLDSDDRDSVRSEPEQGAVAAPAAAASIDTELPEPTHPAANTGASQPQTTTTTDDAPGFSPATPVNTSAEPAKKDR
jgi:type IV pilus assembly protein PilQ